MIDLRHADWDKPGFPCVNIVESPAPPDLLMECQEGGALHAALRQARIPCRYYLATNKAMFKDALGYIAKQRLHDAYTYRESQPIVLHVSCHGNDKGIRLTDGESFLWDELHPLLLDFARQALAYHEEAKVSSIILCMSACSGLGARKMGEREDRPFMALVAPRESVHWSDCLVSFLVFYNLFLLKDASSNEAVRGMNAAAGIGDLFHIVSFSDKLKRGVEDMRGETRANDLKETIRSTPKPGARRKPTRSNR